MGGMNSGRRGGGPTKEGTGAVVLDVNWMMRLGAGASAWRVTWSVTLGSDGPQPITMFIRVDRAAGSGVLRLAYNLQHFTRSTGPQDQAIALKAVPCHFGGHRWFFVCPMRRCRVTRLYLPNGAGRFAGRRAYGLGYQSQRETRTDRAWGVIRRANARLGYDGEGDWIPKPKWMRWRTFNRLYEKRDAAEAVLDEEIAACAKKWMHSAGGAFETDGSVPGPDVAEHALPVKL